jgi:hypothetical protein
LNDRRSDKKKGLAVEGSPFFFSGAGREQDQGIADAFCFALKPEKSRENTRKGGMGKMRGFSRSCGL